MILEYSGLKWIEAWAKERIDDLHLKIEAPLDIEATNTLRGQIQDVRRLLEDSKRACGREGIAPIDSSFI